VVEWPENDFRVDYARLGELREALPGLPLLAVSATPTPSMWHTIRQTLQVSPDALCSRGSIYRPNLVLKVKVKAESGKPGGALVEELQPLVNELAAEALTSSGVKPTIIYTHRIALVDKIRSKLEEMLSTAQAEVLPSQTIRVGSYHGSGPLKKREGENTREFTQRKVATEEARLRERESTQLQFLQGQISVVVANEAFGMGIDHQHIRRVVEIGSPKLLEQLLNHFGRAGRDQKESICTLICKPQDFNAHEAHINFDAQTGAISGPSHQRQLGSLAQLRAYSENVSACRWRFLLAHWQEDSILADEQWRCGKCDNCIRLAGSAAETENFDDIALLMLVMLRSATTAVSHKSAKWAQMKVGLARGRATTQLSQLKARVDEKWSKAVWTQTRLRHMLSVLCELPVPLVLRSNSMKKGYEGHFTPNEQYSLAAAGSALLAQYDRGEPLPDLNLPIPLFLLQRRTNFATSHGHTHDEHGSGDDRDKTDSEREDLLEDGQRVIHKHSETLYIPQSVVSERGVGKKLQYRIRWKKWHDLTWEPADGQVSPGSCSTWRDTTVVAEWETAKQSGNLVPYTCLQLKLGHGRRGVSIGAELAVVQMPSLAMAVVGTSLSEPVDPAIAEERAAARRAAQEHNALEARAAQAVIASVPWAIRFALMACDASEASRPDIEILARDAKGRELLTELSEANGQASIHRITARHRLPRLRVPSVDSSSALIYAVVVGPSTSVSASASASASWSIIRYEGPFRRRSARLRHTSNEKRSLLFPQNHPFPGPTAASRLACDLTLICALALVPVLQSSRALSAAPTSSSSRSRTAHCKIATA
jgi:superfamily II DNA helicase RecQ